MSYILDALKRAEAERSRGAVPNIHAPSVPVGTAAGEGAASSPLMWLIAAPLLALLAAAVWWWSADRPAAPGAVAATDAASGAYAWPLPTPARVAQMPKPQAPVAIVSAAPSSPLVFKPLPSDPVANPPSRPTLAQPAPTAGATKDAATGTVVASATDERIYALKDLPSDVRAALPTVTVGGASYSENPSSRMLIINGQIYHEGDKLTPELTLQQIQLRSAVLSFRGYRYAISY